MLGRILKAILLQSPRGTPPHEQRFRVVRRSGADFYAVGVLPQFRIPSDLPRIPHHELICKKVSPSESALYRTEAVDGQLVKEILDCEANLLHRGLWAEALYGGRFSSVESATHWIEFRYCVRAGSCRHLVAWPFDFGISPHHNSSQIALEVCEFIIDNVLPDLRGQDLLIPSKNARRFWHTAIERKLLYSLGVVKVN